MSNIKFGTDGFRAVIAEDFTYENVKKIVYSIISYLKNTDKPVLIGYDPRFCADRFAKYSAELFCEYGFNVYISKYVVPTPVVAFYARQMNSAGALMFSASHNPYEYLGLKFIPSYGGPATSDITDALEQGLDIVPSKNKIKGKITEISFQYKYFRHIENLIDFEKIKKADISFLYDGLYSASIGYFDEILKRNAIKFDSINLNHDPYFGGGLPEPKAKYMKNFKIGQVCFANDGDADRFGVIDEEGVWVKPEYIIALLAEHLIKNKGMKGKIIKTVGASQLLDDFSQLLSCETLTTAVGFKHVGQAMRENETLIGGEESGGLSIGAHIPEKDGILANLLILEAMAYSNTKLCDMVRGLLKSLNREYLTDRIDIRLNEPKVLEAGLKGIEMLHKICELKITQKDKQDGLKLFLEDKKSRVLIRKSGTEPLLRIYLESDTKEMIEKMKDFFKGCF